MRKFQLQFRIEINSTFSILEQRQSPDDTRSRYLERSVGGQLLGDALVVGLAVLEGGIGNADVLGEQVDLVVAIQDEVAGRVFDRCKTKTREFICPGQGPYSKTREK